MPGPTTRGTYLGRGAWEREGNLAEKRAAEVPNFPKCRVCRRPMVCGQERSNGGAHFVCAPTPATSATA